MQSKFKIIWKGRSLGLFDIDEIRRQMRFGKFGDFHIVELEDGRRMNLKNFLEDLERGRLKPEAGREQSAAAQNATLNESIVAYSLCGLCFLHPALLIPLFAADTWLVTKRKYKLAALSALTGVAVCLAGIIFFRLLTADGI